MGRWMRHYCSATFHLGQEPGRKTFGAQDSWSSQYFRCFKHSYGLYTTRKWHLVQLTYSHHECIKIFNLFHMFHPNFDQFCPVHKTKFGGQSKQVGWDQVPCGRCGCTTCQCFIWTCLWSILCKERPGIPVHIFLQRTQEYGKIIWSYMMYIYTYIWCSF